MDIWICFIWGLLINATSNSCTCIVIHTHFCRTSLGKELLGHTDIAPYYFVFQSIQPMYASTRRVGEFPLLHMFGSIQFSSVRFSHSVVSDSATPWIAAHQASLSITNSRNLLKLMSIESVMPSSHLILCHSLLLLPPIPPSIRVFSNESTLCMRWPKYWSFSFNISPSNEHPGWISFRIGWLDLLVVQGTLKSLLQHHSSKTSVLLCSAFFTVQLSHPCMTTGKTITLTKTDLCWQSNVSAF